MFDYLQKYNQLPENLRRRMSAPEVLSAVNYLEKKFNVDLAVAIMKVMTKDLSLDNLLTYFQKEYNLSIEQCENLVLELKTKVFSGLSSYLGLVEAKEKKEEESTEEQGIKSSSFFFSAEDEEEIRALSKKINGLYKANAHPNHYKEKIESIIQKSEIQFGSNALLERFKYIIRTFLRGVRGKIDTKQTLMKSFEEGGLDFDEESARKVLAIAQKVVQADRPKEFKAPPKIILEEDLVAKPSQGKVSSLNKNIVRDVGYDLSQLKKRPVQTSKEDLVQKKEKPQFDTSHELAPPPPQVIKKEAKTTKLQPKTNLIQEAPKTLVKKTEKSIKKLKDDEKEIKLTKTPKEKPKVKFRKPTYISGKKSMQDVRHIPRVMNPVDELRYMSLVSFRRINNDPQKVVDKILEKINLLEEEKYSKRVEGIKAWRQSPVNKIYLKIGQLSLAENKPISVIASDLKKKGQDYLEEDEFEAIMSLNKRIRF